MIIRKLITFFAVLMLLASTATAQTVYTGTISETVTVPDGASITLNNATITGGIVCDGSATITLVGTNSVSGAYKKAGIQIGGSGTALTIKGDGSLTANGGYWSAGIGLSAIFNYDNNVSSGDIIIEGGTITAIGGYEGAGIGTGIIKNTNNDNSTSVQFGNITIKGGTMTATDGGSGDGIGKGYSYPGPSITFGIVTIYDGINMVDASSISESVTYMHDETDVTANASNYFTIAEDGDRRIIAPKDDTDYTITIADDIEHGTLTGAATAKYMEKVTITATPDLGYRLSGLVVKDADNNDVATTGNSFFMPKGNVTVSAGFEEGTHGTTEFKLLYPTGPSPEDQAYETIYDGVTTVNLQRGRSYQILKYDNEYSYRIFLLDNSTYAATIPYSGGTGTFVQNGTNFNVDYNGESGFYDITMTDVGNDKWRVSIQKTVPVIDNIPDQTYTGSEITPEPLVTAGSLSLTKGTDYEYSYTNNTDAGTATVRATFKGNYASLGYVEKEFNISKATPTVTAPTANTLTYNGNEQELVAAGSTDFGTVLYSLDGETYSDEIPKGKDAGTYTVYYKVDTDNYYYAPQVVEVTISQSEPVFKSHTLLLSGQIGVNFYMDLSMLTADEKATAVMEFTVNGKKTTDNFDAGCLNPSSGNYYGFTCYINAVQMADEITAVLKYGDGKTVSQTYSLTLSEDQNGITAEIGGDYNGSDVAYSLESDIENVSVIFNRTFTAGVTSTIVLPFDIEAGGYSGGDFYEFSDIDTKTWTATMSKVTSVKAHTPYLFVPSGESLTISQKVTLKAASSTTAATTAQNGWTFTGVYQKKVWNGNDGGNKDYCFAANSTSDGVNPGDFVKIGTYVQVRAFRCYLTNSTLAKSKTDLPEKITIRLIDETSSVVNPDDPDPLNPEDSGDITTPVSEITPNSGTKVWSYDRTIFIEAQSGTDYQIIDLSGRMLLSGTTNSTREEITLNRTVGIVIVKIGGKTFKVNY